MKVGADPAEKESICGMGKIRVRWPDAGLQCDQRTTRHMIPYSINYNLYYKNTSQQRHPTRPLRFISSTT